MVKRLFVEKKKGFDVEAKSLLEDIKSSLHIGNIKDLRMLNMYDVEGLNQEAFDKVIHTVFSEPAIDNVYIDTIDIDSDRYFAYSLLLGQYDQRADSAEMCIRLINPDASPTVKSSKLVLIYGDLTDEEFAKIKDYCINTVDSEEISMEKPNTLEMETVEPEDVEIISGFIDMEDDDLAKFLQDMGMAMNMNDLREVHKYFKDEEKRNPTITELKVIDTYWSDHCRHTTFNTKINKITFDDNAYGKLVKESFEEYLEMRKELGREDRDINLMDMACLPAKYMKKIGKLDDLDESEEINACSININVDVDGKDEEWLLMFKNETHNHPTEIEPFGGAATCLGGAIRDPLSGRSYVYQAMRVTGSGDPRTPVEETLSGKLPQIKITREAAHGYSSYGNQIGLATGLVDEIYDKNYVAKRMEVGAVIGAAPKENVIRKRPEKDDIVILVGGKTGRDGCGGATGSSKEHTENSMTQCGAEVQKGNPPVERNIQRFFRRKEVAQLIKRCNDFGAGGVSVAIGELADGLRINLDTIQKKYNGLDGTELAISESQERMAVVVDQKDKDAFINMAKEENLEATVVAKITDENRVVMSWRDKEILNLSREFLNSNGATAETDIRVTRDNLEKGVFQLKDYMEALENLNCCSKKGLIERFDSTIGANTVLMPLGGKYQLSPQLAMVSKIPLVKGYTNTASGMAYGYDPDVAKYSPYHGGMYAVIDSVTKLIAVGGKLENIRLSFQEYFEKLTDESSWGKPMAALLGAMKVQKAFEIAAIGGKDSMSGTFMDIKVPPALISFAVTTLKADNVVSTELKQKNSDLILLRAEYDEADVINFEKFKENLPKLYKLYEEKKILSANTIGKGGVFISLVKMSVGNKIGFTADNVPKELMFTQNYGGFIFEVDKKDSELICETLGAIKIGETNDSNNITIKSVETLNFAIDDIIARWTKPLEEIFPTKPYEENEKVEKISFADRNEMKPRVRTDRPKVIIPLFPGTNCELDSARAFEKAGAETEMCIIKNIDKQSLENSIDELAKKIDEANIIMIPGGFSGGDEPDGSAKFITAVFRNPKIKEAVTRLLDERDGLMLGICNGFQALIKLGLVPFGKILDVDETCPTLTYNKIGRHISGLVKTQIASVKSPWFKNVKLGEVYNVAISHGEGRFICEPSLLEKLKEEGQIATQYVGADGDMSMDIQDNPNYSTWSIEGITSKDGRILGKMGHSERIGDNLYKNVIGENDMKLFESAVEYFK